MPWSEYKKPVQCLSHLDPCLSLSSHTCRPNTKLTKLWKVKPSDGYRLYLDVENRKIGIRLDIASPYKFTGRELRMSALKQALKEVGWLPAGKVPVKCKVAISNEPPEYVFTVPRQ